MIKTDFIVLGAGIAGLSYALKVAGFFPEKQVCVISKTELQECNTRYAQGGIAAVTDMARDSFQSHLEDTLRAGGGLCNQEVAEMVVREAPGRIQDLLKWGVEFDLRMEGGYHLGKEGGHSHHRILHTKDSTGRSIEEALIRKARSCANIQLLEHVFALDFLLSGEGRACACCGVRVMDLRSGIIYDIPAKITMLASGGAGQVYGHTTNPLLATGDGIAMASRAGATTEHMEFVQFHPTALFEEGAAGPAFLITEALRGQGAELRNQDGEAFMKNYHPQGSLAPRDVVARAITLEMQKADIPHLYLDATHIPVHDLTYHFPAIMEKCKSIGIDPSLQPIPVVPAAHYFCGGVKTDTWGRTSIQNLYASGECASTGLHGANRLASNSLVEALVFSERAFLHCRKAIGITEAASGNTPGKRAEGWTGKQTELKNHIAQSRQELQLLMDKHAGIIRSRDGLKIIEERTKKLIREVEEWVGKKSFSAPEWEFYNMLTVSRLVVNAALERREGVGLHYLVSGPGAKDPVSDQAVV